MKKRNLRNVICALSLMISVVGGAFASEGDKKLKIFSAVTKSEVESKMKSVKWAGATLDYAHKQVDKYVDMHITDSLWIISRMQMYWKNHYTQPYINGARYSRSEGHAPVPTVRFTGARDWATDWATPSLEEIVPYMDYRDDQIYLKNRKKEGQPWEWVDSSQTAHQIEKINENIVEKAMYAAFIYWLNGEEKYAKFAYDIFMKYTDGIYYREAPVSEIDHRSAHIVGLTSFEVIHERVLNYLPLCYDFLYDYIKKQDGDLNKIHAVFQKFADQIIKNGVATNNWNVFQACFVTYLALSLEEDSTYENGKGQQYYIDFLLNKNVQRQKALRDVCEIYDPNTGMWNESPGYSMATTKDMLEIALLMDGVKGIDIFKDFGVVEKSALASFEYLHPNFKTVAFGDNGYSTLDYAMYESLLALYRNHSKTEEAKALVAALNSHIKVGLYDRIKGTSLYKLFNYVEKIDPKVTSDECLYSNFFYAPNLNLTIQRNGMDRVNGLMCVNSGTGFNHNHDNGINLELYGKGFPLGVDKARGSSYWSKDHGEYYKAAISHNTVLIDGVSKNSSREMKPREVSPTHKIVASFPEYNLKDADEPYSLSFVDNQFWEQSTNSEQRRVNGIIRISPTSGYYVDIFRSRKKEGGDKKHEYLYHNAGQSFTLFDKKGAKIAMSESRDLTSEGGQVKGYDYLTEKQEVAYTDDFQGTFELNMGDKKGDVRMDVWMKGYPERKIFSVMTPRSLKGLGDDMGKEIENAPIPAMIVRQNGEAWSRPFVAIYEPYTSKEGRMIESVEYIDSSDSEFVGIEVESILGREYILNRSSADEKVSLKGITFQGVYGVVSTSKSGVSRIFLGEGSLLQYGGYAIEGHTTALVEWAKDGIRVKSSSPMTLVVPKKGAAMELRYVDGKGKTQVVKGVAKGKSVSYALPALDNAILN